LILRKRTALSVEALKTAIKHSEVVDFEGRILVWTRSKVAMLGPASIREIFGSQSRIHAAVYSPVKRITGDKALTRGIAERRNEEPALATGALSRMFGEGEIKHRDVADAKACIVDLSDAM